MSSTNSENKSQVSSSSQVSENNSPDPDEESKVTTENEYDEASVTQSDIKTPKDSEIESEFDDSDSDTDLEDEAENLQVSKEFEENVIKFVKLDDLIRKKNEEVRELKKMKKPCEEFIIKYLDKVDIACVDISDGKLRRNKSENKVAINYDTIKEAIAKKIVDPKVVEEILKLVDQRPTKTNVNIKRTKNRGERKLTSSDKKSASKK